MAARPRRAAHALNTTAPPPSQIFNAYSQKKAIDVKQIKFVFDGQRLLEAATPESMDMEDGDGEDQRRVPGRLLPVHRRDTPY